MKKLSVGAWITCFAALLAVAAFIAYSANIGGEGYYKDAAVNNFALAIWGAAACLVLAIALYLVKGNKIVEIVTGVLRVAAPALMAFGLMNLIAGRVDGLGYIYFSNADVAKEVQTAANPDRYLEHGAAGRGNAHRRSRRVLLSAEEGSLIYHISRGRSEGQASGRPLSYSMRGGVQCKPF